MRRIQLLPLLFFLTDACIDPLAVEVGSQQPLLVVDGMITDEPGPYQVKLLYSSKPDTTTLKRPTVETGASVWITDDFGESELLTEIDTTQGTYQSSATGIRGQVGRSYYLRIITADKTEYISAPQILSPAGQIDRIYAEFKPNSIILKGTQPSSAFSVFIDAHGTSEGSNFFRWRWTGTYKGQTFPERRMTLFRPPPPGRPAVLPDPEPCSGYVFQGGRLRKVAECSCCICWVTELSNNAIVSDNRFAQDFTFNKVEVAKVAVTNFHFFEKYRVEVEQLSLSEEAYDFWKLVQAQQRGMGSIFQPNSVKVKGNIKCVSDPKKGALGVFSVSGVSRKSLFIDRSEVPVFIPPIDSFSHNCMADLPGERSTNYKPDFW